MRSSRWRGARLERCLRPSRSYVRLFAWDQAALAFSQGERTSPAEDLSDRAKRILTELRANERERPVFIEFSGTPKSGKSTCIDIVAHFFRRLEADQRLGFKVLAPAEGPSRRTPYYLQENWMAFNTWSASYALMHVLEGLHGSDRYDSAILDRGLFDALAWFELLATQGKITPQERDQVQSFLQIDHWRSPIDAVLLFKTDASTAMEREARDKLIDEPGSAMNERVLEELNDAYEVVSERYAGRFSQFEIIDTSESKATEPKTTAVDVARPILDVFENHLAVAGIDHRG